MAARQFVACTNGRRSLLDRSIARSVGRSDLSVTRSLARLLDRLDCSVAGSFDCGPIQVIMWLNGSEGKKQNNLSFRERQTAA